MADGGERGWKQNPVIGIAAVAVLAIALVLILSRLRCGGAKAPEPMATLTVACTACQHIHEVGRADVGCSATDDDEVFRMKAQQATCPKCGDKGAVIAFTCRKCGKPFAPPQDSKAAQGFTCPHCGKSPWLK